MTVRLIGDPPGRRPPLVTLVSSQLTGLSGGRGALARGYEEAPIAIAVSALPSGAHQVTVARATNAAGQPCPECRGTGLRPSMYEDHENCPGCLGAGRTGTRVDLRWENLCAALNLAEELALTPEGPEREERRAHPFDPLPPQRWGGNPASCILGSPKPAGTRLPIDDIVAAVTAHARWVDG